MPRTFTVEYTVYQFDELSPKAKEKARDWMRQMNDQFYNDFVDYGDFTKICTILGVTLNTHEVRTVGGKTRREVNVYWRGFACQGDGASFEGFYRHNESWRTDLAAYAPKDEKLHAIGEQLDAMQERYAYTLTASITTSGHYTNSASMDIDCEAFTGEVSYDDAKTVKEALRALADWFYKYLEAEYYYRMSDEAIDEDIAANEYEFNEDGTRA